MFETLKALGIQGINFVSGTEVSTREERRDVWLQRNDKSLKMGSKGLRFSDNIAYHGFVLYANKEGMDNFSLVKPCGYDHSSVSVTSIEDELGKKIDAKDVHYNVKQYIMHHFGYTKLKEIRTEDLHKLLDRLSIKVPA